MHNFDRNSEKQVTLEDLLRLKKLERPDSVFWEKFDKQLHENTLKKLFCKRSILSRIFSFGSISLKPAIPVGALALLTFTIFAHYQSHSFYAKNNSVIEKNSFLPRKDQALVDFAPVKRNYVKNSIIPDNNADMHCAKSLVSPASYNGIRYLAGKTTSLSLANAMADNAIY